MSLGLQRNLEAIRGTLFCHHDRVVIRFKISATHQSAKRACMISVHQCCTFPGMIPVFGLFLILLEWYGMGGIYGMRAKFDSFD